MFEINYAAVALATVLYHGLGALWYSPLVFAARWMELEGITQDEVDASKERGMAAALAGGFLVAFVVTITLAVLISLLPVQTPAQGMLVTALVAFGPVLAAQLPNYLFTDKPLALWGINAGYHFVGAMLSGTILSYWR